MKCPTLHGLGGLLIWGQNSAQLAVKPARGDIYVRDRISICSLEGLVKLCCELHNMVMQPDCICCRMLCPAQHRAKHKQVRGMQCHCVRRLQCTQAAQLTLMCLMLWHVALLSELA